MPNATHRTTWAPTLLSMALALVALTGCSSAPKPEGPTLLVGSWNIEWLGQPDRRSGPASGVAQRPEDLADYIAFSGVSVLALQEITTDRELSGVPGSTTMDEALRLVSARTGGRWRHTLFPSARNQNVGVAWDETRVTLLSDELGWPVPVERLESSQGRVVWSRPPRAMFFSAGDGKTDFVMIPVHMKSNWGGNFAQHRALEARTLVDALERVRIRFGDLDVMVIGDTNCPNHADEAIRVFEDAGLVDLNDEDHWTYWRTTALDRALVPGDQVEFADREFEVVFETYTGARRIGLTDFKARWSDHLMVVTPIRVMDDDD